jgi:hypothetical protein
MFLGEGWRRNKILIVASQRGRGGETWRVCLGVPEMLVRPAQVQVTGVSVH